jgi:hypothetical protein
MNEHPTPELIMQVGMGFWPSKILLSAVEMEVFTDLAKGPYTLQTIQGRMGLHPRASRDFLDALVALGFLHRSGGEYSNTPAPICSLISTSRLTSVAFSKWRTNVCTATATTSRKRCAPDSRKTKCEAARHLCSRVCTPIPRG